VVIVPPTSGKPFEPFLNERIFDPLGMVDTVFHVPADKAHRFAACYSADGKGGKVLQDDPTNSPFLNPPTFVSGGGGLVSTTADYLKFCRMLLGRGALANARLLSPKTLALMTANHLPGGKTLPELSLSLFSEATTALVSASALP
jgi:CubicO group peptidase (beta-lactamase class C family)